MNKNDPRIIVIDINKISPKQEPNPIREELLKVTERKRWRSESKKLLKQSLHAEKFTKEFHTHWTEAGHHIRAQVGNDQNLVRLLRAILPKYNGSNIRLYRGENLSRWNAGQVGLCWTSCIKTAEMFGGGLNAIDSGGILLEIDCPPEAIISGPSSHSNYLGESEYTVDPFQIPTAKILKKFPGISIIQ